MATIPLKPARYVEGGMIRSFPEAASQSFKRGEFVYLVSGKVTVCASDGTTILGMAMHAASTTVDTDVQVAVAYPDTIFCGNVYHGTPGSAITAITTCQAGSGPYALYVASNKHHVDISDTSNDAIIPVSISTEDTVGDTYGHIYFKFMPGVLQGSIVA